MPTFFIETDVQIHFKFMSANVSLLPQYKGNEQFRFLVFETSVQRKT